MPIRLQGSEWKWEWKRVRACVHGRRGLDLSLPRQDLPGSYSYRFGAFELDVARKELRRAGLIVPIAPKPLELLILLLRHRDRMVSRAETLAAVWPGVCVSDAALASTLRDLRRVLDDDALAPAFVQTARGLGFRFVAPVAEARRTPDTASDRARDGGQAPFVGRDALLERIEKALAATADGHGRIVLLEGEPGIGKSRTLAAISQAARVSGAIVCHARFPEAGAGPAYRPWGQLLTALVESRPPEWLGEELGRGAPWIARLVPGLSAEHASEPAFEEDDEGATLLLFDAVTGFLCRVSRKAPLVLVLDDLHGADRSSLRLLEHLADEIHRERILILGAYRSCELDPEHALPVTLAELARAPTYTRIRVEGIDLEATRALAAATTGREPEAEQLAEIHARTGGNPFYVQELACHLAQVDARPGRHEVPPSLCELLRGSLQRLPLRCRDTIELAAVVGREFDLELLRHATGLDLSDLTEALVLARRAGLVDMGWGDTRRFRHTLVQEAIYAGLPEARRRALHRRVGEACRKLASADRGERLAAMAHHLCQVAREAGPEAVDAAVAAAEHAEANLAFEEAARLYGLALDALDCVDAGDYARRCPLLLALARAQLRAGERTRATGTARRAAALARTIARPDLLARAALLFADNVLIDNSETRALLEEAIPALGAEHEALRGRSLAGLANSLWHEGQVERRVALAEQALAIARAADPPRDVVVALLAKRHALQAPAHLQERLCLDDQALREADCRGDDRQRCLVLSWRPVDLLESGERMAAERDVASLEEIALAARQQRFLDHPARWRATLATIEGRFADAERWIAESARWRQQADLPTVESFAGIQLAALLRERGRQAELEAVLVRATWWDVFRLRVPSARAATALIELEGGRPGAARRLLHDLAAGDYASLRDDPELLFSATWLAEICAGLGAREPAAALYARLAPFRDHVACLYAISCRGSLARYLGLLAATAGQAEDAAACYEASLAANRAIGAALFEAWTQWDYARLLDAQGDCGRAAALAGEARATAERLELRRLAAEIDRWRSAEAPAEARVQDG